MTTDFRRACVVALACFVLACSPDLRAVKSAQRTGNASGHELASFVINTCEGGYDRANTDAEIEALDDLGCIPALRALTLLSAADVALVALVDAYEAGQCRATLARDVPARCDMFSASRKLVQAGAELARAVDVMRSRGAK